MSLSNLLPRTKVQSLVDQWLLEDSPSLDIGGFIVGDLVCTASLFCKRPSETVLAGIVFFDAVFDRLQCTVEWEPDCVDGGVLPSSELAKRHIATVRGPVANILQGERIALNCISRASGIATSVASFITISRMAGWKGRIACTRKTTPGFRLVEKYAVVCGGGDAHRYDLGSGMVMLKDNHIDACGGDVEMAVSKAKQMASFATMIEVEARNAVEAMRAAAAGADVVMLDNFLPQEAKSTARTLKDKLPGLIVEVSGGIDVTNITDYLDENIDVVSMSCLTQGYSCVDFSLKILGPA